MSPRPPAESREAMIHQTRQRLLDAAAEEFALHGFDGANINRISIAAGFAKGTIYNYFSSKRDLMTALIGDIATKHICFIKEHIDPDAKAEVKLTQFFQGGFSFVEQYTSQARIAISIVYGHDQEFKQYIFDVYTNLFILIQEEILGEGVAHKDFVIEDTDMVSALLMSIYLGSISLLSPDGKIGLPADQVARFIMDGIGSYDRLEKMEGR